MLAADCNCLDCLDWPSHLVWQKWTLLQANCVMYQDECKSAGPLGSSANMENSCSHWLLQDNLTAYATCPHHSPFSDTDLPCNILVALLHFELQTAQLDLLLGQPVQQQHACHINRSRSTTHHNSSSTLKQWKVEKAFTAITRLQLEMWRSLVLRSMNKHVG